jgi:hypothetical protein
MKKPHVHMINSETITPVMSPDHPDWDEFCNQLAGPQGCHFQGETWNCHGDHRFARKLLAEFGVDVEASIAFFEENGAGCDCETLMNLGS